MIIQKVEIDLNPTSIYRIGSRVASEYKNCQSTTTVTLACDSTDIMMNTDREEITIHADIWDNEKLGDYKDSSLYFVNNECSNFIYIEPYLKELENLINPNLTKVLIKNNISEFLIVSGELDLLIDNIKNIEKLEEYKIKKDITSCIHGRIIHKLKL